MQFQFTETGNNYLAQMVFYAADSMRVYDIDRRCLVVLTPRAPVGLTSRVLRGPVVIEGEPNFVEAFDPRGVMLYRATAGLRSLVDSEPVVEGMRRARPAILFECEFVRGWEVELASIPFRLNNQPLPERVMSL